MDTNPDLRKPRRLKGTYSYQIRNYVALGVLSVGAVTALVLHYSNVGERLRKSIKEGKFEPTEYETDRKMLMGFRGGAFSARTAEQLSEVLSKANEDLKRPEI